MALRYCSFARYVHRYQLATHLEYIVAQRIEQIISHNADGIDARLGTKHHSGLAELDGLVLHGIEDSHL